MTSLNNESTLLLLRDRAESFYQKKKTKNPPHFSNHEIKQLFHELQVHQIEVELQNQELQESRAQLEIALSHYTDLYDSAMAGFFTLDSKGFILKANKTGASILKMEREKIIGKCFVTYIINEERTSFYSLLNQVFNTQISQSSKITLLPYENSSIILQIEMKTFNNGEECRIVAQDITDQIQKDKLARLHEFHLTQLARVNSMGELATAIAHEINQPLTATMNYVNGCIHRIESNQFKMPEILDALHLAAKQIELAGKIIHHMKNIVRQDESFYKIVNINDIAIAACAQIQKETQINVSKTIKLELSTPLPLIKVDHIQIELVILNLLRNSLESIAKNNINFPEIILRTEGQEDTIIVKVIDNGPHYSAEEEMRLFEPRFTTKKEGMGMGLPISRTIVETHCGYLTSYKMPGKGVCFQFSLPIFSKKI